MAVGFVAFAERFEVVAFAIYVFQFAYFVLLGNFAIFVLFVELVSLANFATFALFVELVSLANFAIFALFANFFSFVAFASFRLSNRKSRFCGLKLGQAFFLFRVDSYYGI